MLSESELQAIEAKVAEREARASAATDGPWEATEEWRSGIGRDRMFTFVGSKDVEVAEIRRSDWDAAFIAAARADVPDACAEERALLAEVRRLRGIIRDAAESLPATSRIDETAAILARAESAS